MKFSLVIPCYNESKNIPLLLERCVALNNGSIEVILVDNGSTDNTAEVMRELMPKYPHCRSVKVEVNQGYGFGILSGLRQAKGEIIGWTHADLQTDPRDFLEAANYFLNEGNGLFVKGKRFGRPLADIFFTIGMSLFESVLFKGKYWDINAQPTVFSKSFFDTWTTPPSDFSLDLYAYVKAVRSGLVVKRFSVNFGKRAHGVSHWNVNWASKRKFIKRTLDYSLQLSKTI